jgi:hypothetical protein
LRFTSLNSFYLFFIVCFRFNLQSNWLLYQYFLLSNLRSRSLTRYRSLSLSWYVNFMLLIQGFASLNSKREIVGFSCQNRRLRFMMLLMLLGWLVWRRARLWFYPCHLVGIWKMIRGLLRGNIARLSIIFIGCFIAVINQLYAFLL